MTHAQPQLAARFTALRATRVQHSDWASLKSNCTLTPGLPPLLCAGSSIMPKVAKADKSAPAKGKATKPAKKEKDPNAPKKPLGECMRLRAWPA